MFSKIDAGIRTVNIKNFLNNSSEAAENSSAATVMIGHDVNCSNNAPLLENIEAISETVESCSENDGINSSSNHKTDKSVALSNACFTDMINKSSKVELMSCPSIDPSSISSMNVSNISSAVKDEKDIFSSTTPVNRVYLKRRVPLLKNGSRAPSIVQVPEALSMYDTYQLMFPKYFRNVMQLPCCSRFRPSWHLGMQTDWNISQYEQSQMHNNTAQNRACCEENHDRSNYMGETNHYTINNCKLPFEANQQHSQYQCLSKDKKIQLNHCNVSHKDGTKHTKSNSFINSHIHSPHHTVHTLDPSETKSQFYPHNDYISNRLNTTLPNNKVLQEQYQLIKTNNKKNFSQQNNKQHCLPIIPPCLNSMSQSILIPSNVKRKRLSKETVEFIGNIHGYKNKGAAISSSHPRKRLRAVYEDTPKRGCLAPVNGSSCKIISSNTNTLQKKDDIQQPLRLSFQVLQELEREQHHMDLQLSGKLKQDITADQSKLPSSNKDSSIHHEDLSSSPTVKTNTAVTLQCDTNVSIPVTLTKTSTMNSFINKQYKGCIQSRVPDIIPEVHQSGKQTQDSMSNEFHLPIYRTDCNTMSCLTGNLVVPSQPIVSDVASSDFLLGVKAKVAEINEKCYLQSLAAGALDVSNPLNASLQHKRIKSTQMTSYRPHLSALEIAEFRFEKGALLSDITSDSQGSLDDDDDDDINHLQSSLSDNKNDLCHKRQHYKAMSVRSDGATVAGRINPFRVRNAMRAKLLQEGKNEKEISFEMACHMTPYETRREHRRRRHERNQYLLKKRQMIRYNNTHSMTQDNTHRYNEITHTVHTDQSNSFYSNHVCHTYHSTPPVSPTIVPKKNLIIPETSSVFQSSLKTQHHMLLSTQSSLSDTVFKKHSLQHQHEQDHIHSQAIYPSVLSSCSSTTAEDQHRDIISDHHSSSVIKHIRLSPSLPSPPVTMHGEQQRSDVLPTRTTNCHTPDTNLLQATHESPSHRQIKQRTDQIFNPVVSQPHIHYKRFTHDDKVLARRKQKKITKQFTELQKKRDRGELSIGLFEKEKTKLFGEIFEWTDEGRVILKQHHNHTKHLKNISTHHHLHHSKKLLNVKQHHQSTTTDMNIDVTEVVADLIDPTGMDVELRTDIILQHDFIKQQTHNHIHDTYTNAYKSSQHYYSTTQKKHCHTVSLSDPINSYPTLYNLEEDDEENEDDTQWYEDAVSRRLYGAAITKKEKQRRMKNLERREMLMRQFDQRAPPEDRMFKQDTSFRSDGQPTAKEKQNWIIWWDTPNTSIPEWMRSSSNNRQLIFPEDIRKI